jgi:hypothetical protein
MDANKLDALKQKYAGTKGGDTSTRLLLQSRLRYFPTPIRENGRLRVPQPFSACLTGRSCPHPRISVAWM